MWTEIIGSISGIALIFGAYYGLYKITFYFEKKKQLKLIEARMKEIEDIMDGDDGLKEHYLKLEALLKKLKEHKVLWRKNK